MFVKPCSTGDSSLGEDMELRDGVPTFIGSRVDWEDSSETETVSDAGQTMMSIAPRNSKESAPTSPKATSSTFLEEVDSNSTETSLGETLERVAEAVAKLMVVESAEDDDDDEEEIESHGISSVAMFGSAVSYSDNSVGSHVSSISSVPTTTFVPQQHTHIENHPSQYIRWSDHLDRLHELGFLDDTKNIFVLEMLMAANEHHSQVESSSSNDEDVTLEQVVNALVNAKLVL